MYNFYGLKTNTSIDEDTLKGYFKSMHNGNLEYRNMIVEQYLFLVLGVVKQLNVTNYSWDDLMGYGNIGLIKAVDTFDTDKGFKFVTYAKRCVLNEILMFLRRDSYIHSKELRSEDSEGFKYEYETTASEDDPTMEYDRQETTEIINKLLSILSPRAQYIVKRRYGFDDGIQRKQKEIAQELNISQSFVSRVLRESLKELKNNHKTKDLVLTLYS